MNGEEVGSVLVIFDCDGVLVDSESLANASFSAALRTVGLDWTIEETMRRLMGRSVKSCVEICEAELGGKLPDDFVAEAPYGEYIIREGKGRLSIVAIPPPKTKRTYAATPALERKLRDAKGAKEIDCPPDFFTEPLED